MRWSASAVAGVSAAPGCAVSVAAVGAGASVLRSRPLNAPLLRQSPIPRPEASNLRLDRDWLRRLALAGLHRAVEHRPDRVAVAEDPALELRLVDLPDPVDAGDRQLREGRLRVHADVELAAVLEEVRRDLVGGLGDRRRSPWPSSPTSCTATSARRPARRRSCRARRRLDPRLVLLVHQLAELRHALEAGLGERHEVEVRVQADVRRGAEERAERGERAGGEPDAVDALVELGLARLPAQAEREVERGQSLVELAQRVRELADRRQVEALGLHQRAADVARHLEDADADVEIRAVLVEEVRERLERVVVGAEGGARRVEQLRLEPAVLRRDPLGLRGGPPDRVAPGAPSPTRCPGASGGPVEPLADALDEELVDRLVAGLDVELGVRLGVLDHLRRADGEVALGVQALDVLLEPHRAEPVVLGRVRVGRDVVPVRAERRDRRAAGARATAARGARARRATLALPMVRWSASAVAGVSTVGTAPAAVGAAAAGASEVPSSTRVRSTRTSFADPSTRCKRASRGGRSARPETSAGAADLLAALHAVAAIDDGACRGGRRRSRRGPACG